MSEPKNDVCVDESLLDENETAAPEGMTLFIDYSKCIGCETCEAVCGFIHDAPRINMTRTPDGVMVPLYCHHCDKPHCLRVCTKGAVARDRDGAVVLQPMLCRGCETRQCVQSCPYSAMFLSDRGGLVRKCDLCASRRDLGMGPACVAMCPTGAIQYVDRSEVAGLETEESKEALEKVLTYLRPSSHKC
ncbi:(Fe-S)-binding protein [Oceanidesulfovibrio marinus]|uniref:(Fe-S)-binding protein n=2 Tax=Oceanidesulfovibrio marinus TaxID=370038 RepID=A0A6P1ZHM1_9BACT|nr:(Fe-S)-binding protein [Oceanidesulfovibrio marinus]TVM32738.1 (Fe-S)-binding protein [Oceanidesulfovibrio marinus]